MGILSDFKHSGGTMVAMICGDTHTNDYVRYNDVNYYISQGYGWIVPDLMLPGARHAFFDYKQMMCVDVIAVKPSKREVHSFRIGAGGAEYDFGFSY